MAKLRARFPFELVITVGDNIYGGERPQDMKSKFEEPYKALLDGGVKFYASLGNHDDRAQARYALFNMEGRTYYTFKAPKQDVRFFALETDYLEQRRRWRGSRRSSRARARTGRSRTSTIRSTRRASATGRTPTWPRCSNRCS